MRIAFPVDDDNGLESNIFEHFGHAPYYLIVDISDDETVNVYTIKNPYSESHEPGDVPTFLASQKVDLLICMGIGRRAVERFNSLGIEVVRGAYGTVKSVLDKYLNGLLESREYNVGRRWDGP